MSDQRLTDLSYLEQIGMGDDSLIIEMIEMFITNTPKSLEQLRQHNADENWKRLAAEAHKLKPNLSYVGLNDAREIIKNVEESAKNNPDQQALENKIDQVEDICKQAYGELHEELEELKK